MTIYTSETYRSLYCVYLTIYRGNKLPPFYIGSTSIAKLLSGYKGSVSSLVYKEAWIQELENNPHLFVSKVISVCMTREEAYDKEDSIQRALGVMSNPLYINKAYSSVRGGGAGWNKGLKLTDEVYKRGGRKNKGKVKGPLSPAHKDKLKGPNSSKANSGAKNGMYGKTHTDEVKAAQGKVATIRFKGKTYEELYGKEKADSLKSMRSASSTGKDNAGKNNPRARRILIVDPSGKEIECFGNLRHTCKELGLPFHLIYGVLRDGATSEHPKIKGYSATYVS